jgi:hypothetical protein
LLPGYLKELAMQSFGDFLRSRIAVCAVVFLGCTALIGFAVHMPAHAQTFATTFGWMPVGPSGGQIGSGKVNAFAYVASNPKIMYIGGGWGNTPRESPSQSGIYRTIDGGSHWVTANSGLTNTDGTISSVINGLWLDQANPSVVLAATEFGGTFRSTNGGTSWVNVDHSESTQFAKSGSTLLVATARGVLKSADDGATWAISLSAAGGASTVVTASSATYAGLMNGDVYHLSGTTWLKTGHPGAGPVHNLAIDPFNTKIVYANVDDATAWNENLYGSIDGGVTWKFINCPCSIGAQAIAFSLVVPHRMYLGDDGSGVVFYFTADGNPNPTMNAGTQPFGVDLRYIITVPGSVHTDDACYILTDQGLFFAPRCSSGTAPGLGNNIPDTLAYDVKVTPNATHFIVALQDNSAAKTLDGGVTWTYPNSAANAGEGGESFIDPANPLHCYFAHPDQGLWVSSDGCATFFGPVTTGMESLTFDPLHAGRLYAITNANMDTAHVSISTDYGNSWTLRNWSFTNPYQIAVSPTDANTIIVATGNGNTPPRLWYTHNGGVTWTQSSGLPASVTANVTLWFPVHRFYVAFQPRSTGTVLLVDHDPATDNVLVFRSVDNAKSFAFMKTFVQPTPPRPWPHLLFPTSMERARTKVPYYATRFFGNRLAFNPQAPTGKTPAVILTTRFGAFLSNDSGSTWQRLDTTLIAHHFVGAAWKNGYGFLASFGQGVLRSLAPLQ